MHASSVVSPGHWNVTQRIRRFSNSGFSSGYLQDFPTLPNPMLSDSDETLFFWFPWLESWISPTMYNSTRRPPLRPSCKRKEKSREILIQVAFPSLDTPSQSACFYLLFRVLRYCTWFSHLLQRWSLARIEWFWYTLTGSVSSCLLPQMLSSTTLHCHLSKQVCTYNKPWSLLFPLPKVSSPTLK